MTMLLKSEDGSEFELGLIEDRLPEIQDGFGDSAHLTVSFRVATPEESWEETSPSFNTFELKNLVEWLETVADASVGDSDRGDAAELDLLEPELNFRVIRDTGKEVVLRVGFHLEDRPAEFDVDTPTDEASHVDLRVSREHLRLAAAQLREDLETVGRAVTNNTGYTTLGAALKDDLLGEGELGEVRPPTEDLGLTPHEVDEEGVGFGTGLDEGEEAIMGDVVHGEDNDDDEEIG